MLVLKDTPSHISIDSLGLYLCIYRMFVKFSLKPQAFIQALLSTAVFPPKIHFLYCLLSSVVLRGGPIQDTEEKTFGI